jgi:hypothetical protein
VAVGGDTLLDKVSDSEPVSPAHKPPR